MFPSTEVLNEQLKDKTSIFQCFNCNKTFRGSEMLFEDSLPDNMHIASLDKDQKIPKCPHCGTLAFFGFQKIK